MKRNVLVLTILILVLTTFSFGCKRTVPIQDFGNSGLTANSKLTANQVRDAIVRAGASIGWKMNTVSPGLVTASWVTRSHSVTVDIPYTADKYTIKYRESSNLLAEGGQIHSNYNRWVDRLNRNIAAEIRKK